MLDGQPAASCGKINVGDRILKVNDFDVSTGMRDYCITALKMACMDDSTEGVDLVRAQGRSMPPQWESIRLSLALRAYAPWGCIVRVAIQTKLRKIPIRNILPLFSASRPPHHVLAASVDAQDGHQLVRAAHLRHAPLHPPHAPVRREPFNFTPMAVNSISSGSPRVRPMGRTCGEPDEIKKNTHPKNFTALFRERTRPVGLLLRDEVGTQRHARVVQQAVLVLLAQGQVAVLPVDIERGDIPEWKKKDTI